MGKDYYKILGVTKGASDDEIKKAYRKMALKGDPMRMFAQAFGGNGMFGDFSFSNGGGGGGQDIFEDPFAAFAGHGGGGHAGHRRQKQDPTVQHELPVSLEDICNGCTKKMKITRKIVGADGTTKTEDKVLSITIKPGWKSGTKITFPKEGDQLPNRVPADIAFVIKDKPHPKFKREGSDIRHVLKIPLRDSLCGVSLKIPTLDGTTLPFQSSTVIKPHSIKRFPQQGLPNPKLNGTRGDLIVEFDVRFPDALSPTAKEMIMNALPPN